MSCISYLLFEKKKTGVQSVGVSGGQGIEDYIYKYFPAGNWSKFPTFVRGPLGGAEVFSIHVALICAFLREGPFKGFSLFWKE